MPSRPPTPAHVLIKQAQLNRTITYYGPPFCKYCGERLARKWTHKNRPENTPTAQHIIPFRRGGKHVEENVKLCCKRCNELLNAADDCPAALVCGIIVAKKLGLTTTAQFINYMRVWPRAEYTGEKSTPRTWNINRFKLKRT